MLATLHVSVSDDGNISDNGELTLREAIAYVNGVQPGPNDSIQALIDTSVNPLGVNDRIVFESGLSGATIALHLGELSIFTSMTIDASMLSQGLTIDAGGNSRILGISGSSSALVELNGLTLRRP